MFLKGLAGFKPGMLNGIRRTGIGLSHQKLDKLPNYFSRAALKSLPMSNKMNLAASVLKNIPASQLGTLGQKFQARFGYLPKSLKQLIDKQLQAANTINNKLHGASTLNSLRHTPQTNAIARASEDALKNYNNAASLFRNS